MSRKSKSRRFVQQGALSVHQHDLRFPYRSTYKEAEDKNEV
ncbi:competence protein [Bacillaceae bacterium SIJ1]|nr:competence protein [Litoribacterium kuwaitense]NGP44544.1 competence protein [Litoribacterium kuwaitense]